MDDEARFAVKKQLKARNGVLEARMREMMQHVRMDILDHLVETYEDQHRELHKETSPQAYREFWSRKVFDVLGVDHESTTVGREGSSSGSSDGGARGTSAFHLAYELSGDPVNNFLLRRAGERSRNIDISKGAEILHKIGPTFLSMSPGGRK
ncbi:hypothetical protein ABW20_dc0110502 [Dactylellina cionopaga]|nr:hypothetical protein ABW20_dc0110502 [Dactylellina cionopaga]